MEQRKYNYTLSLAGVRLRCSFEFPQTAEFFGDFVEPSDYEGEVNIPDETWQTWTRDVGPHDAYNEYSALSFVASEALMKYDRCVIHAAAVKRDGKAFLICAPSGVGKTTQVRTLMELYPGEFSVISGDRPVLEFGEPGEVIVHPSPWNGKENICGAGAAPLAAVVLLRRGETNELIKIPPRSAAVELFTAIFQLAEDEFGIRAAALCAERILNSVPVVRLINAGVPDSTRLLCEGVFQGGVL